MVVFNSAVSTVDFPTNRLEIYVINGSRGRYPKVERVDWAMTQLCTKIMLTQDLPSPDKLGPLVD
jgi:hypothetical protein